MKFVIMLAIIVIAMSARNRIYDKDEKFIAFRSNILNKLEQNTTEEVTLLRPDEESTPLKLSKEQLGRFSW
jgi:hypothetical protein